MSKHKLFRHCPWCTSSQFSLQVIEWWVSLAGITKEIARIFFKFPPSLECTWCSLLVLFLFQSLPTCNIFFLQLQWLAWAQNNKNISHRCKWGSLLAVNKHCHARTLYPWRQESTWIPFRCHGYSQRRSEDHTILTYKNVVTSQVWGLRGSCLYSAHPSHRAKKSEVLSRALTLLLWSAADVWHCEPLTVRLFSRNLIAVPALVEMSLEADTRHQTWRSWCRSSAIVLRHLAITPSSDERTAEPRFGNQSKFFSPPKVSPSPLLTVAICS